MTRDTRGTVSLAPVLVLIGAVIVAGVVGGIVKTDSGTPAATTNETATPPTTTETATTTETTNDTATATPASKNVTVIIEHWSDKVGIIVQDGADADAITEIRVEGATMDTTMDLNSRYPRARGTVTADTVRVVATFEDGTEQVIAERNLS